MPQVSTIERELTEKEYAEFEAMVRSKSWTIDELVDLFADRGFEFSKTAMGRQKQKILLAAQSYKKSRIINEAIADELGEDYTATKTGELVTKLLNDLTLESMFFLASESDEPPNPKILESYAKIIKSNSSAIRLNQDYAEKERKRIAEEERAKAADIAENAAIEGGASQDQVAFIRAEILGISDKVDDGKSDG